MKKTTTLLVMAILTSISCNALNYFWVGGSGNWSDYQNHFATTSGGSTFHNQVPQSTDNVFFDANSFNQAGQTITVDQTIVQCADLDWTGVTNTPTLFGDYSNTLRIYGSLTLSVGVTFNFGGNISLESTATGKTITTAGIPINASFIFNGIGGGWTLQDSLSTYWIYLNNGTLNTNNQIVNSGGFWSNTSSARALTTGSSTFNLSGFYMWNITSQGMTLNAANSIIKGTATGSYQYIYGGGLTYNDIFFSATSTGIIYDNNTIHDITFAGSGYIYGSTCNDVSFTGSGTIESGNFHNVSFADDASMYSSTCNNVTIAKNGNIRGTNSFNNLTFSPGYTYILEAGQTQTILTSITVNGNCGALIGIVKSSTINSPATISKASGNVTVSYVTLKDINATGGAIFTANNSIDLGNNSGWTINPLASKNLYWIGNSGNWNDGNHWSTTSGGAPSGCSPLPVDNIFFDANSFSQAGQSITVNVPTAYCKNMDWTGVTNSPTIYGNYSNILKIYGSLTLANGMSSSFTGNILFEATTPGQTITTAGIPINTTLTFNGVGGEWTLQDALNTNVINLNNGILNTNSQTVNADAFWSNNSTAARTLNTGSSIFNLSSPYYIWNVISQGMTMNAGSSIINGISTSGYPYFYGGGLAYNDIFFTSGANGIINDINTIHNVSFAADGYINGSNCNDVFFAGVGTVSGGTFHDVSFASNANIGGSAVFNNVTIAKEGTINSSNTFNNLTFTPGFTYILEAGQTQTIGNSLTVNGNCGALIGIVKSSSINSQASIAKASGIVTISFVTLKDINATGGATFIANNAIDLGNNSGWTINVIPSKNLYWVGNGGNWNDGNQWSTSSGGAPSGCSPTPIDNVFFDANSFSLAGQTVMVNTPTALCNNMDWTGVTNAPTIYGNYSNIFKIYGSLTLASSMTWSFSGEIRFEAITTGQTITTAGIPIITTITFNGIGGGWTLNDALTTNIINLNNGVLNTNNQTVTADGFWSTTGSSRTLNMGSSTFNLSSPYNIWYVSSSELTINSGSSLIKGTATGGYPYFYGAGLTYNDIAFTGGANGIIYENNNTIHDISFAGDGYINGGTIHDVSFVGSGSISGGSFHDVSFASNANISGSGVFNNVTIAKQGDINSSNTFNNLTFSPGYTYTLQAGQTQTVQNICAQGNGSLPIRIQSNSVGVPTTISKASGTICWDYVRVSDITATGGASFNAGLAPTYSEDMGGNTGLLFTGGCTPLSCTTTCEPPSITVQPDNSSVCDGSNTVFAIVATGTDLTYQWQVNDGTGFTNLSNTAPYNGITTNTLSITTATIGLNGYQYRCIVNGTCAPAATSNGAALTVNPLPIVTANSSTICSGQTAILSASGAVNYVWSIGGMMGDTSNPISVSPVTTATYSVTGITNGCSNTAIATVTVNPLPTVIVNSTTVCSGQTATLTASGATTYTWSNGATTNVISVSPATTVSYTVTGTTNGCANTAVASITVNPLPAVTVNSATICSGQTATLTAIGATTYAWSNGATTNSISVSPITTATYTVIGITNGCSNTAIASVTVNPLPTVNVNSATVCSGQTTTLTASGATTYTWSNGATTNVISISPSTTTSYTVTGATNGCSNTAIASVTVNPLPTVTVNSATVCSGQTATLTANGATNYTWSNGATTNIISVSPTTTTSYTVTGTTNGCSSTAIATIAVNPLPIVTALVSSTTVTVSAIGGTPPYTGTGTFTGLAPGTYSYTVTDANGCGGSTSVIVTEQENNCVNAKAFAIDLMAAGSIEKQSLPSQWYKFHSPINTVKIELTTFLYYSTGIVNKIILWGGTCSDLTFIASDTMSNNSDTTLIITSTSLTSGNYYYLEVIKSNTIDTIVYVLNKNYASLPPSCINSGYCPPTVPTNACDLVCNGGFELNLNDPDSWGQIERACGWDDATNGSSDYFKGTTPNFGVPSNILGTQTGHLGSSAYAGFFAHANNPPFTSDWHEYIYQQLRYPLVGGVTYQVSFWVSRADHTAKAVNTIGAYFSATYSYTPIYGPLPFTPQISCYQTVATDANDWTKISGTFVANGGEKFIVLGDFGSWNSGNLYTAPLTPPLYSEGDPNNVYYYLDDVSVVPLPYTISATPNPICLGSSVTLNTNVNPSGCVTNSVSPNATWSSIPALTFSPPVDNTTIAVPTTAGATVFTGTVTYHTGCTKSPSVNVIVKPTPTVAVAHFAVCSGATVPASNFISQPAGATYSWTNSNTAIGLTATSGTGNVPSFTATNSTSSAIIGIIQVTPTLNGCTGTQSNYIITVNPMPVAFAPSSQIICTGTQTNISLSSNISGTTFAWTVSQTGAFGASAGSGNTIAQILTATGSSAGTVTYTVTPTANGCSGMPVTVIITVKPSGCCLPGLITLTGNISNYTGSGTGQNFTVTGTLFINQNFTFSSCNIIMAPNAKIQVNIGKILTITNKTHIYACTSMWDKISVQTFATLKVNNNSFIEDGTTAISIENRGNAKIDKTIFNRNLIAIELKANTSNPSPLELTGSVITSRNIPFSATVSLNPAAAAVWANVIMTIPTYTPANLKAPYLSIKGNYGINATNVRNLKVGAAASIHNGFDGILCGINIKSTGNTNTSTTIYNNYFQNFKGYYILPFPLPPLPFVQERGIGIKATAPATSTGTNDIIIGNMQASQPNGFYNTHSAVLISGYKNVNIVKNTINNSITVPYQALVPINYGNAGISVLNPAASNIINILQNTINNCVSAVWINRALAASVITSSITVNSNTITADATSTRYCVNGINIQDVPNTSTATPVDAIKVQFNTVINAQHCITASNVKKGLLISRNPEIGIAYDATATRHGIRLISCQNAKVYDNCHIYSVQPGTSTQSTANMRGIYVYNTKGVQVQCNQIYDVTQALLFEGTCLSSNLTTIVKGNKLNSAYYGLYMKNSAEIGTQGSASPPVASENYWYGGPGAYTWQTFVDNVSNVNTSSKFYVRSGLALITVPTFHGQVFSAQKYINGAGIISIAAPAFSGCSCTANIPPPGGGGGGIASLAEQSSTITQLLQDTASTDVFAQNVKWQNKKYIYQKIDENTSLAASNAALSQFYATFANFNIGKLSNVEKRMSIADNTSANTINATITPNGIMEENQKRINELILQNEIDTNNVYSSTDSSDAYNIAQQCPNIGGDAVIQARALYSSVINNLTEFDDVCIINTTRSAIIENSIETSTKNMRLYPNPNDGNMVLEYSLSENETGILNIYDLTGKLIHTYHFNNNTTTTVISANELNAGIYMYDILINNATIKTDKLIIIK